MSPPAPGELISLLTAEIIVLLFWDVPLKSLSDVFSLFCSLSSLQVIGVPENKVSFLLLFPLCSAVTSSHQAEGVYQLPRGCSDPLGVRKHQPCGLLHRGAQWDGHRRHTERHHWVRTVTFSQNIETQSLSFSVQHFCSFTAKTPPQHSPQWLKYMLTRFKIR